ncbi:MAG: hypothetical protein GY913_27650 [Proteobacteria bacterium]|nr:hypothetical protein [Pseudomonadota bacterium]MCP4920691.1 hypothetical protein [Pseudomonadota bacterium]
MWSSLAALLACTPTDPGFGSSGTPDDTAPWTDTAPPEPGVYWAEELHRRWSCPEGYKNCVDDYLALPQRATPGVPLTEAELESQLEQLGHADPLGADLDEDELAVVIRDALHPLDELLAELPNRHITATVIERTTFDGYVEEQILIEDPVVGELKAWLLIPDQAVDRAILPLHGHNQWGDSVLDFMGGRDYPAAGYLTMNVTFRVDGADAHEDQVTRALLLEGQSFLAIRIYEQVLIRHLIADRFPEIQGIGVLGHSGSSVASNLALRVVPPDAYVSDLTSDFADRLDEYVIDHTVPGLHPYADRINELDRSDIPVLEVPYGYEDDQAAILDFFDEHL